MFSILGALQTLEKQQYEASYVDGAGAFKQFWYITLPSISSVIGITTLLSTIWTFNDFENVYLITGGGPLLLPVQSQPIPMIWLLFRITLQELYL